VTEPDQADLLRRYDEQLRAWIPPHPPAGWLIEHDGPLIRVADDDERGFVTYRDLAGLDGDALDRLIARQRDYFAARGQGVEWKLHGHDRPANLPERLLGAGFEPEEQETVVIGRTEPMTAGRDPDGITFREVTQRADLDRIAALESEVWSEDRSHLAVMLAGELAADPDGTTVVVAEADGRVVCAGWVRYVVGTSFATLWGGSTLPAYRGRGCYSAVVRRRAQRALERGHRYLQVDASDDSRPILVRAGFIPVTTTTPYVHTP
jgi:GNAT superfamily N-acetyltransferase